MQFSLTNTGITILSVLGFTHGRGYSLLTEESIVMFVHCQLCDGIHVCSMPSMK